MDTKQFGRTDIKASVLSFGCGNVGGLMIRGDARNQEKAVAHAIANGITYFDTAAQYGNGQSETNLGRALKSLNAHPTVATKLKIAADQKQAIRASMIASIDASLSRLARDTADLLQLHNTITSDGRKDSLTPATVLNEVVPVFLDLQKAGKIRYFGMTGMGDTSAILQVVDQGDFYSSQVVYNLLNPSAAEPLPLGFPAQDYERLIERANRASMGTVGIRIIAGGALRGPDEPHQLASKSVSPMGSGGTFDRDFARGNRFQPLVENGFASSIPEAAIRYALSAPGLTTAVIGLSDFAQLEATLAAAAKGPLDPSAMTMVGMIRQNFIGEER